MMTKGGIALLGDDVEIPWVLQVEAEPGIGHVVQHSEPVLGVQHADVHRRQRFAPALVAGDQHGGEAEAHLLGVGIEDVEPVPDPAADGQTVTHVPVVAVGVPHLAYGDFRQHFERAYHCHTPCMEMKGADSGLIM